MNVPPDLPDIDALFDRVPAPLVWLDAAGRVVRLNPAAERLLARPADGIVGRRLVGKVLPVPVEEEAAARLDRALSAGDGSLELEAALAGPEGERRLRLRVAVFGHGGPALALVAIEDRTDLAREEERRRRAERMATVGELAAGVAHEVNNPLAAIRGFAQLMARETEAPEHRRSLEIIIEESARVGKVVEKLLSFARRQGVGGREPVDLSAVAEGVVELQRYALDTAGVEVRLDLDRQLSPVMGEPGALKQVVLNLVVNAEQALASQSGHRLLIVRTRETSEGVVLSIFDNGPGISREILPAIFESFRSSKPQGSGLGLAISATIVREHGGQIIAESEPGRGAAFFVRLPRADAPPAARPDEAPSRRAEGSPAERPLRVLVADDEATLRLAIAMFLGRRGHEVTQAADAAEALRLAGEREFDVALVDVRMPGDGLRLIEELEKLPALRGRTALMTGDIGRARTTHGIATGRPCLIKPFDLRDAVDLVEALGA